MLIRASLNCATLPLFFPKVRRKLMCAQLVREPNTRRALSYSPHQMRSWRASTKVARSLVLWICPNSVSLLMYCITGWSVFFSNFHRWSTNFTALFVQHSTLMTALRFLHSPFPLSSCHSISSHFFLRPTLLRTKRLGHVPLRTNDPRRLNRWRFRGRARVACAGNLLAGSSVWLRDRWGGRGALARGGRDWIPDTDARDNPFCWVVQGRSFEERSQRSLI